MRLSFHIVDARGGFHVEQREVEASGLIKIGRLASSHLHLNDATVSRIHAVIECDGEAANLIDLGSASGTLVNGKPINKRQLRHWDEVRLGDVRFYVGIGDLPPGRLQAPPPGQRQEQSEPGVVSLSRRVQGTPLCPIGQLPDGLAAVRGRVGLITPLTSPVTGIPVVGFQLKVSLDDGGPPASLVKIGDFTLEDETGRALVQTQGCRLVLERQYMLSSADTGSVAIEVIRELRRAGQPLPGGLSGTFSWEEYYLEPGETAYVCGRATTQLAAAGYRDLQVQRLIGRPDDGAFVISDLDPAALAVLLES